VRRSGETELRVQAMRVSRREEPAPEALQLRMFEDASNQPCAQTASAVIAEHEDIGEIGEHRPVGHHAGETGLRAVWSIQPERQGVRDRPLEDVPGNPRRPICRRQELVQDVEIQLARIG
jgi:hypothetical protein